MPNNYVAKRHFFASSKVEHDASDNDDIDTKEVADLVRSLEEDKDTENLRELIFQAYSEEKNGYNFHMYSL